MCVGELRIIDIDGNTYIVTSLIEIEITKILLRNCYIAHKLILLG